MKATGRTIWQTALADSFMQMEMYLRVNGSMIRQMVKGFIFIRMGLVIQESGRMISKKALG